MKHQIFKLSIIWSIILLLILPFIEYVIIRPINDFIQVPLISIAIILILSSFNYTIKYLFKY